MTKIIGQEITPEYDYSEPDLRPVRLKNLSTGEIEIFERKADGSYFLPKGNYEATDEDFSRLSGAIFDSSVSIARKNRATLGTPCVTGIISGQIQISGNAKELENLK